MVAFSLVPVSAATTVSTIVYALSDGKFSALIGAVASIINTILILTLRHNVKKTRRTNKEATDDLLKEVQHQSRQRKRHH